MMKLSADHFAMLYEVTAAPTSIDIILERSGKPTGKNLLMDLEKCGLVKETTVAVDGSRLRKLGFVLTDQGKVTIKNIKKEKLE
jgi:hypothetical protein